MNQLIVPRRTDFSKPVMEFFEEGDWWRIVVPGLQDRFLHKKLAMRLLQQIRERSVAEKSDLVII